MYCNASAARRLRRGLAGLLYTGLISIAWPRALPAATLALSECRIEHPLHLSSVPARCAELQVPENRGDASSRRIGLAVAVIPALSRNSAGSPVFLLAGGPGQAASAMYASYAAAFARINRDHDIVLVDQRGTGGSSRMQCEYPDDWAAEANAPEKIRAATRSCLARLGDRVRFYTTAAAVQDLDSVRKALGVERIDLYAASYGTRVAQSYMRRFATHVEAAILDGVVDPEPPIGPQTPLDAERALDLIVARCAADAACARAYPQLASELASLRARFEDGGSAHATRVRMTDPTSGVADEIEFTRPLFNAALRFLSYGASEAALLPELMHQAFEGNPAPLAAQAIMMARQAGDQIAIGMQNSVVCSEDWPFYEAAHIDRAALARTYQGTDQLDGIAQICALWPRGPVDSDLHAPWRSDTPVLLLSGEADPVTPVEAAERAARGLSRYRHLVLRGEGHGQLATACVPRLMAEFLANRNPQALDAHCLDAHEPAPFFVSPSGPPP